MIRVITFGTYDLFHIGHLNILRRAADMGDHLTVGISSDELNESKKGFRPLFSVRDRMEIVRSIKDVDSVFIEESLEKKREYIIQHRSDILVMGDDWAGGFDDLADICRVVYLSRTEGISTTSLKARMRHPL